MKKINVAVIGIGRMGSVHARNLKKGKVRGAKLQAICDIKSEALTEFTKKYGQTATYLDYKAMLKAENIDAVIIATEHYFHADIAIYCMEQGLNVLVEKPLSVTTLEAKRVIERAKEHSKQVTAVMFNQRTNPLYARAKRLVEEGKIGEIQRVNFIVTDWYRSQAYYNQGGWRASLWGEGGGTLINQCIHQLDLIQWIIGLPKTVFVKMATKNRQITTENDVVALFKYDNDVYCSFTASTHELRGANRLEIAGTNGRIVIDSNKMKVYTFAKDEKQINNETKSGYGFVLKKTARYNHRLGFAVGFIKGGQQLNIVRNFLNGVMRNEKLISPIADGLNAVMMINAMYLSAWENKEISLPIDDVEYTKILNDKIKEEKIILGENNDKN
ncbi:MAG: Gfo/Idh/MocA family oxidoreductase [Clostridia bacterium]